MKSKLLTLSFIFIMVIVANLNAAVTYIHTDALGSVVAESDASGSVVKRYHYAPYGKTEPGQDDSPGYTGHVFDDDLGLSYMKARYYDPEIGRFYSNDPAGFSTGNLFSFNRYAYANNNPYKFVDPDGKAPRFFSWSKPEIGAGRGALVPGTTIYVDKSSCIVPSRSLTPRATKATKIEKVKPVEKDSKGDIVSREPKSLQDKMVLDAAKKGAGELIIGKSKINDKRFPNHDKFRYREKSNNGKTSSVHYMKEQSTGERSDFKFKDHTIEWE